MEEISKQAYTFSHSTVLVAKEPLKDQQEELETPNRSNYYLVSAKKKGSHKKNALDPANPNRARTNNLFHEKPDDSKDGKIKSQEENKTWPKGSITEASDQKQFLRHSDDQQELSIIPNPYSSACQPL